MILKYLKHHINLITPLRHTFSQPIKKRTSAPRYQKEKSQGKIDPKDIDYSKVPQDLRKGVKAYVQASNMLVTSQAQLETMALKQVITQERQKFIATLEQTGVPSAPKESTQSVSQSTEKKQTDSFYDLMKAIKFTTLVSNTMLAINCAGYGALYAMKKYEYLGFFLGLSLNPSIVSLTALSIGFNAAAWIIIQSLHLSIKDPNELTLQRISLTNCSPLMYLQALSILFQASLLSHYLMQANQFGNIWFLFLSFGLSQLHLCYSILKATNGYKFQVFSKLLIMQISVGLLLITMVYSLMSKISQANEDHMQQISQKNLVTGQGILLAIGYKKFLQEFKQKKIAVVKGQAINQLVIDEKK